MNRKKALLKYEIKRVWPIALIGVIAAILCLIVADNELGTALNERYISYGNGSVLNGSITRLLQVISIPMGLCIAIASVLQFGDWHKKKNQEYLLSLPFTRKERFLTKVVCGYGVITIVAFVLGGGILLLRHDYESTLMKINATNTYAYIFLGNDTFSQTVEFVIQMWLMLLAVYSIFAFVHMLVGRGIPAAIIGAGICAAPCYLYMATYMLFIGDWFESIISIEKTSRIIEFLSIKSKYAGLYMGTGFGNIFYTTDGTSDAMLTLVNYPNIAVVIAVLAGTVVLMTIIGCYIATGEDMARAGMVVQKRAGRRFLGAGIGACVGIGAGILGSIIIAALDEEDPAFGCMLVITVLVAVAVYALFQKILSLTLK